MSNTDSARAPDPLPSNSIGGGTLYPKPGSKISIVSNSPSIRLTFNSALRTLTVPTVSKLIKLSTFKSYKFSDSVGISSKRFRFVKLIKLANGSCNNTELIRSTVILRARNLSINILCLGLNLIPYFCLAGKRSSGTLFPASSYPAKLSIHFCSIFVAGTLVATPSVNNWYSLCIWF